MREGHSLVPKRHTEAGFNLGHWVVSQRVQRAALTDEKRWRLEAVSGWSWDPVDTQWETAFGVLAGFVAREGHARVPKRHREAGINLGTWIATQRATRDQMAPDRRDRLASLPGWTWDSLSTSWDDGILALAAFAAREGHTRVPRAHFEGSVNLGSWLANQRSDRDRISAARRARLESVPGWVWSSYDADWERAFSALAAFVSREGHAQVPANLRENGLNLGNWISHQRKARDTMLPERRERLEATPGWTWSTLDDQWNRGYAALGTFVAREQHANVPQAHREQGLALGPWVRHQRAQRDSMAHERVQLLEALPGWAWDANSDSWEKGFSALLSHVAQEGTAQVRKRYVVDGVNLGSWVVHQRAQRAHMAPERADRLQELPGWSWDPQADQWNAGLNALATFALREGHTKVPASHVENGFGLGRWVRAQRTNQASLPQSRRARLGLVPGWVWR
jgi:hypothetical protein